MEEVGVSSPIAITVDDDQDFNELLKLVLAPLGIKVMSATSADQYFGLLNKFAPNLCLIDLNIGSSGEGLTIVEKTRLFLGPSIPIFVVSAMSAPQMTAHAIEVGANDYIVKPINRQVLASKLSNYLPVRSILLAQLPIFPVPDTEEQATVTVEFSIISIDELGIVVSGEHLIFKGSDVWMSDPLISEITNGESRIRLIAHTSSAKPDGTYLTRLEFDLAQEELLGSVRKWLTFKLNG